MQITIPAKKENGGAKWLISESQAPDIFIPEDFSEEQKLVKEMCIQFMDKEVRPYYKKIDSNDRDFMLSLLNKAGELGLMGVAIPEQYGGLGKDYITDSIVTEWMGNGYSFSIAHGVHLCIGTAPIVYFGTEEQKLKYLPKLASGEWIGAYCLTEPGSGSDALAAKTTAVLSDDGKHYILNGQKCWISNGGFAHVYVVFAKIQGEGLPAGKTGFTAFIVERDTEGFMQGPDEHKMGLRGSSTTQLYFQNCKIPVENVLGDPGRGHLIAFNILNLGRYALCCGSLGISKMITSISLQYAISREQFATAIANFGAIKYKLAEMAIRNWVVESALYRTGMCIENAKSELLDTGETFDKAVLTAAEEYAIECAILKIAGSELSDYVVDEGVQIHGGNGFSDDYEVSHAYRDVRVYRIFEGTNEINRILIADMLFKRAAKGKLDILSSSPSVKNEQKNDFALTDDNSVAFETEKRYIHNFKKLFLSLASAFVQKFGKNADKEQEILMNLADIIIQIYLAESALLRVIKLKETYGESRVTFQLDIMQVYLYEAAERIYKSGKDALNSFDESEETGSLHTGLRKLTDVRSFNIKSARRRITDKMIEEKKYCF